MGLFGLFKRKRGGPPEGPAPDAPAEPEAGDEDDDGPVTAVVVVREGMALPSADEMRELVEAQAPEHAAVPRVGLAQPHWWKQDDWVAGGLRQVARALVRQHENDPDRATWRVVADGRGARVGLVFLRA